MRPRPRQRSDRGRVETLQIYLGSSYVNDFSRFERTFQVIAQADSSFRDRVDQIGELRARNSKGDLVPIGSVVKVNRTFGPDPVVRYNGFPAADLAGASDPAQLSSEQAIATVTSLASTAIPCGFKFEWTDLSYQQVSEGRANLIVFPLAILLVFLVLAALYESWILPLAILLIVPLCVLAALIGVHLAHGDRNIFVQIGLVVLMGLATKNAILIVEFARDLEQQGLSTIQAAIEACRLRLRPIVMTSVAFIAGVTPLMVSTGPGSEVRRAMGVTVFAGMIGVTFFGLVLTPVFYVALRTLRSRFGGNPFPIPQEGPSIDGGTRNALRPRAPWRDALACQSLAPRAFTDRGEAAIATAARDGEQCEADRASRDRARSVTDRVRSTGADLPGVFASRGDHRDVR